MIGDCNIAPKRRKKAPTASDMRAHIEELQRSLTKMTHLRDEKEKLAAVRQETIEQLRGSLQELVNNSHSASAAMDTLQERLLRAEDNYNKVKAKLQAARHQMEQVHCVLDNIHGVAPRRARATEGQGHGADCTDLELTTRLATAILALLTTEESE